MIRNKFRKGILSLVFTVVFTLAFCINYSTLAYAEETSTDVVGDTFLFSISREDMSQEQIELYEKLMSQNELQVGDVIVLYQTEDEIFYATVTDSNKAARGAETKSKTFILSRSILGFTQDMLSLTITCSWISDGLNSKITNFEGSYQALASGVSCSFNSNYEHKADTHCALCLDYSYGSTTGYIFASASIFGDFITGESMSLSISFEPH